MAKKAGIWHILTIAAIFIALEIAALAMLRHSGEVQNAWISKSADGINAAVWGTGEKVASYFGLRKQNDSLAAENLRLHLILQKYGIERADTIDVQTVGSFYHIPAKVVKHSSNSQHNVLILDKGSMDGVIAGSGVITPRGVIGTIDAVSEHYAHVIGFCNTETVISARAGRDGSVGQLRWAGITRTGAVLSEIPFQEDVQPGDTVFTSGFSSLFPPDIPLGVAVRSKVVNGATLTVNVALFEDMRRTRQVTIASNNDLVELMRLNGELPETEGEEYHGE